ncbi:MAG: M20/M25/M40 family metallo-hydrolase [Desulfobacterales bacterium]|jgi:acetylornithine deacetylase/succinyl-diaminopimelate desuccinylase-like protein
MPTMNAKKLGKRCPRTAEILQRLIQFDTTNPPGNEAPCIAYIDDLLSQWGLATNIVARDLGRPNIIARLSGRGLAPPLMLYGHVDVVSTREQVWDHPPFGGHIVDGFVWGRGALDMKGGLAMMLAALLRSQKENKNPPGDILFVVVSDEEMGGDYGSKYLVENHAAQFEGIRYAIGEFGGFTLHIENRRFYPIMVAEKQRCWMKATLHGPGGHGAMPVRNGAMAKLARLLHSLDRRRLPVHVTPVAEKMFGTLASALGGWKGRLMAQLLNPSLTNSILSLMGERGRLFDPLLHNTVSATVLHGSQQINIIPSEIAVELDGRLLPGFGPEDMVSELRPIVGPDVKLELIRFDPGPTVPDWGMWDVLLGVLRDHDAEGIPVPMLLSGVTDAQYYSRLGIQTYGFLPMQLPESLNFSEAIHGANERIPVASLDFGAEAIYDLIHRAPN